MRPWSHLASKYHTVRKLYSRTWARTRNARITVPMLYLPNYLAATVTFIRIILVLAVIMVDLARDYKTFSMRNAAEHDFFLLINMKTIVGNFIFISKEFHAQLFAIVRRLRFISRTNFMLTRTEHEKKKVLSPRGLVVVACSSRCRLISTCVS